MFNSVTVGTLVAVTDQKKETQCKRIGLVTISRP